MMSEADKGNLPRAETPSIPKEQMGKGVNVGGKIKPIKGTGIDVKGDKQAGRLKKAWGKAIRAKGKFKTFTRNL